MIEFIKYKQLYLCACAILITAISEWGATVRGSYVDLDLERGNASASLWCREAEGRIDNNNSHFFNTPPLL